MYSLFNIVAFTVLYGTIAFILEKNSTVIIVNLFIPSIITLVSGIVDTHLKLDIGKYWIDVVGSGF